MDVEKRAIAIKQDQKKRFKTYLNNLVDEYNQKANMQDREKITLIKALRMLERKSKETTFRTKKGRPFHYSALEYYVNVILKEEQANDG